MFYSVVMVWWVLIPAMWQTSIRTPIRLIGHFSKNKLSLSLYNNPCCLWGKYLQSFTGVPRNHPKSWNKNPLLEVPLWIFLPNVLHAGNSQLATYRINNVYSYCQMLLDKSRRSWPGVHGYIVDWIANQIG